MAATVIWKDPPPQRRPRRPDPADLAILQELRRFPNKWALVRESTTKFSIPKVFKSPGFKTSTRTEVDGVGAPLYRLYVQFVKAR